MDAAISTRHLSFVETGRSVPSREMVLRLSERLDIPLRERNTLLVAAGYAPMYRERALDDPALNPARQAVELILKSHEPYPAIAIDRHWNVVAANSVVPHLLAGVQDAALLQPPMNALRLSLHPQGLAPQIANLAQWRAYLFERVRHHIAASADPVLTALLEELQAYPTQEGADLQLEGEHPGVVMPFQFVTPQGVLSFISTITVFGTPVDVTLQELAMETFFPADEFTRQVLQGLAAQG